MKYKIKTKNVDNSYWKSYSDMMAALLLMFILIMTSVLAKASEQAIKLQEYGDRFGIRTEIIEDLKTELSEFRVSIDEKTGDIKFESDILFDYDKVDLKQEGIAFLNDFMPKYLNVVFSEKYLPYLAEIIIEGHTDAQGGYLYNLELSQGRALSVAKFCLDENNGLLQTDKLEQLKQIITVNGKSFSNPVYVDDDKTAIDEERSRRVEVKFRLKDDETISLISGVIFGE